MINQFLFSALTFLANFFGNNYGFAIIGLTVVIRVALLPLIIPSVKSQRKMMDLKTEVDKLKIKYGNDKKVFQQKQLELYQKHNINPVVGCLPQLIQAGLFIVFYNFLIKSLDGSVIDQNSLKFFWLGLNSPDPLYILPVLAALTQFLLALMLKPATSTQAEKKLASKTSDKKDDQSAQDMSDMAQTMQNQMLFMMPLLVGFFALRLPSGLSLYWVASSIFSIVQQYMISGSGGLKPYLQKVGININR